MSQHLLAEMPADGLISSIMLLQAESYIATERIDEARHLLELIIESAESQELVHPHLISSRSLLAELELRENNQSRAENLSEQAFVEAESLFGKKDVRTKKSMACYALVMAMGEDPKKQITGLSMLTKVHDESLNQGRKSRAVILRDIVSKGI